MVFSMFKYDQLINATQRFSENSQLRFLRIKVQELCNSNLFAIRENL